MLKRAVGRAEFSESLQVMAEALRRPSLKHAGAKMTVKDKKVLVTGGTSGIGEAIARAYAGGGADVVMVGDSSTGALASVFAVSTAAAALGAVHSGRS